MPPQEQMFTEELHDNMMHNNDARFWLASKGVYAVVDWLYVHMWKQLYAILNGCIGFIKLVWNDLDVHRYL